MEKLKQIVIIGIMASFVLGVALVACDNGNTHTHNYSVDWLSNDTQHWHECSCGEKTDIANHYWDWEVTISATQTADGREARTCSICEKAETRIIPQVPFTKVSDFNAWLAAQPINTNSTPFTVKLNVSDLGGDYNTSGSVANALYTNDTKFVSIDLSGSTIDSIVDYAFGYCTNLIDIIIPESIISIGSNVFRSSGITKINIPDNCISIGLGAFYSCTSLTKVTIGYNVASVGYRAFNNCTKLTSVTFTGIISPSGFIEDNGGAIYSPFVGDLQAKYLVGGIGVYTTIAPVDDSSLWMKQ